MQTLRRQSVLPSAPIGDESRSFGRSPASRITLQLGGDFVRLDREAIALRAGCEKAGEHDASLATLDGDADNHSASLLRSQSEAHRGHSLSQVSAPPHLVSASVAIFAPLRT